jgi:hypothetical protein
VGSGTPEEANDRTSLVRLIAEVPPIRLYLLRKRTIAPPLAIDRRKALNNTNLSKEANNRYVNGDRSLPRHAPEGAQAPPSHAHTYA